MVHTVPIFAPDYRASGMSDEHSELSSLGLHLDKTFATFDIHREDVDADDLETLRHAFQVAQAYAREPHDWLVLTGPYGCGKTHLAAAIANEQTRQRRPAHFLTVPDLLDHLRATFSPQSTVSYDKLFEQIRRAPLLVLDDLGTESATAWAKEKLYQLFNYRYNARMPTVVTTAQRIDEIDARLRSRFLNQLRCQICGITAPPFRGKSTAAKTRRRGKLTDTI